VLVGAFNILVTNSFILVVEERDVEKDMEKELLISI